MNTNKAKITPKNIFEYILGNIRYQWFKFKTRNFNFANFVTIEENWESVLDNNKLSHTQEQFLYRVYQVGEKSPECLTNKECKVCGCEIPELFFANKGCGNFQPCYGPMLSKEDWENFKTSNNIDMLKIFNQTKSYLNGKAYDSSMPK